MNVFKSGLALLAVLALSACGKNSIVEKISVTTSQDSNQNLFLDMDALFNMGFLKFPNVKYDIPNPQHPAEPFGKVFLARTAEGKNELGVQINLTSVGLSQLNQDNLLPNGKIIPVGGLNGVVSLHFLSQSKLYLGAGNDGLMMGVAVVIPLFDAIGKYVPGVNLFLPLPIPSGVQGVAGVFTGGISQNGIGIFFKIPTGLTKGQQTQIASALVNPSAETTRSTQNLSFATSDESTQDSGTVKKMLNQMSKEDRTLTVK